MTKYFCNTCGLHFESNETENVTCPNCYDIYDIYLDTAEEAKESIKGV
jgi:rubrerythrin